MEIAIRLMALSDRSAWAEMRAALWPQDLPQAHAAEIDEILRQEDTWGFIAETHDGAAVGFAELAIRKYANGCISRPVPFLEGIWVKQEYRRKGIGARLVEHTGAFLAARGFREIGSDSDIDNRAAHASHVRWGFSETERVVYFRKSLVSSSR